MESQFRKEPVSGDWVLIAAGRNKRPHTIKERDKNYQLPSDCPFENISEDFISVIPNKFPAVQSGICKPIDMRNGYEVAEGVGLHELVITKPHDVFYFDMPSDKLADLFRTYRDRYKEIAETQCGQYIMIFHNYGREAGASVFHPHTQIISVPIIPPDVARSIRGSLAYFTKHGQEAHAMMVKQEQEDEKRILFENDQFIALCPFVSKHAYEVRIYPKRATGYFEKISEPEFQPLAETLKMVLTKIKKNLDDPALNFFIHTAPLHYDHEQVNFDECYRWHIEILPKVTFDAGFEVGTGIRINPIDPDTAAEILRQ